MEAAWDPGAVTTHRVGGILLGPRSGNITSLCPDEFTKTIGAGEHPAFAAVPLVIPSQRIELAVHHPSVFLLPRWTIVDLTNEGHDASPW